jgi:hypothetical protein
MTKLLVMRFQRVSSLESEDTVDAIESSQDRVKVRRDTRSNTDERIIE